MPVFTPDEVWEKIQNGVFVIAEAGKNFIQTEAEQPVSEYLENAKDLARIAKSAGADAIKFQTHVVDDEILDIHVDSPHFPNWKKGRHAWIARNERATPVDQFWIPLKEYCESIGIIFFSTPMSRAAAEKLTAVPVPIWKIGSGDILDFVMMDYLRRTKLPVIMSSGMSTFGEVKKGLNFLREKNPRVALMHCLSKYPGELHEANLEVMDLYREEFPGVPVGFSENSVGYEPSVMAVALGARMVEKHFSVSRTVWGPDHKVSSTPDELKEFVSAVRKVQNDKEEWEKWLRHPDLKLALGNRGKILQPGEEVFRPLFRKALMAACDIPAGTALQPYMISAMRPQGLAGGLPSEEYSHLLGFVTTAPLKKHDPINWQAIS